MSTRMQAFVDVSTVRALAAIGLLASAGFSGAADYCCQCKGQAAGKTINASNRAVAVGQCSVECGNFTNVSSGKCAEPPPAAAPSTPAGPATAPPAAAASGRSVLVYRSADCSGDPIRLAGSTTRIEQTGVESFQAESSTSASVWEKPDYAGRGTAPVGPSICVSPGFEIQSVRFE